MKELFSHQSIDIQWEVVSVSKRDFIIKSIIWVLGITPISALAGNYTEEYESIWNIRKIRVTGKNLWEIHAVAANNFCKNLEKDLKNLNKFYAIKPNSFYDKVIKHRNWAYEFIYTVELIPVNKKDRHLRIIDMRWSVVDDTNAEKIAKWINAKKIPEWQKSMWKKYIWMQYLQSNSHIWSIFHEAILGIGEGLQK